MLRTGWGAQHPEHGVGRFVCVPRGRWLHSNDAGRIPGLQGRPVGAGAAGQSQPRPHSCVPDEPSVHCRRGCSEPGALRPRFHVFVARPDTAARAALAGALRRLGRRQRGRGCTSLDTAIGSAALAHWTEQRQCKGGGGEQAGATARRHLSQGSAFLGRAVPQATSSTCARRGSWTLAPASLCWPT